MLILDIQKAQKKIMPQKTSPAYNDGQVVGILGNGMTQVRTSTGRIKTAKGHAGSQSMGGIVSFLNGQISSVPGRVLRNEIEEIEV